MEQALMKLVQNMINDTDLDSVTIKEFRSILLHLQSGLDDILDDEDAPAEDYKKYIL